MAKRKNKLPRQIGAVSGILLLLLCLFITAAPKLNLPFEIPAWKDFIGKAAAVSGEAGKQPFSVHFIDVGQGDSALIKSGDEAMLIDAGEKENGGRIVQYLKDHGVKRLNYVVCTHPHADHIGGMAEVLKAVPAEQVLMAKTPDSLTPTTAAYKNLLRAISESGAKASYVKPGQTFTLGDALLTIAGPQKAYEDLNNYSVVLRIAYGANAFLFTGDEESRAEKDLAADGGNLRADVLKCGHHGSKTSSSSAFLKAVSPKVAVISCGADNDYGHPHQETLQRLQKAGIRTVRTDRQGTVVIGSDGTNLTISPEKEAA